MMKWVAFAAFLIAVWCASSVVKGRMNSDWENLGSGLSRRHVDRGTLYRQSHWPADAGSDLTFVPEVKP